MAPGLLKKTISLRLAAFSDQRSYGDLNRSMRSPVNYDLVTSNEASKADCKTIADNWGTWFADEQKCTSNAADMRQHDTRRIGLGNCTRIGQMRSILRTGGSKKATQYKKNALKLNRSTKRKTLFKNKKHSNEIFPRRLSGTCNIAQCVFLFDDLSLGMKNDTIPRRASGVKDSAQCQNLSDDMFFDIKSGPFPRRVSGVDQSEIMASEDTLPRRVSGIDKITEYADSSEMSSFPVANVSLNSNSKNLDGADEVAKTTQRKSFKSNRAFIDLAIACQEESTVEAAQLVVPSVGKRSSLKVEFKKVGSLYRKSLRLLIPSK